MPLVVLRMQRFAIGISLASGCQQAVPSVGCLIGADLPVPGSERRCSTSVNGGVSEWKYKL
jgi:hypothetical protein